MIRSSCCCCSKSICRISSVFTLHVKGKENEDDKKKLKKTRGQFINTNIPLILPTTTTTKKTRKMQKETEIEYFFSNLFA